MLLLHLFDARTLSVALSLPASRVRDVLRDNGSKIYAYWELRVPYICFPRAVSAETLEALWAATEPAVTA